MSFIELDDGIGGTGRAAIGPLSDHADLLASAADGAALPCITDEHVWKLHGHLLKDIIAVDPIFVPRGEAAKQWNILISLIAALAARSHPRSRPFLALGGGSVGDVAGLAAALYMRGTPVIQIPTTLLAQVDSAVGGKTAIDAEGQKNLVGTFHSPMLVLADPALLATLDRRQMRAGAAEIVKYGMIADEGFFRWMEAHGETVIAADAHACAEAAQQCIRMKADAVAGDLRDEKGRRALLNFGHTFGHAFESVAGLGTLLHGEAVAAGMVLASQFAAATEYCAPDVPKRLVQLLDRLGLPTNLGALGLAGKGTTLLPHMLRDKKSDGRTATLVLPERIGEARLLRAVDEQRLRAFLELA
ncbi:3-dehydroquinate synthase [Sphingomicrobium lutaoense]|uniref:3-dehydroquinate synthase n=1 Tax=Sphingomicrobium lutaoense TaxID=515949 RepID=A0A839YSN4_9SPHN|nr:3-dehydroquinate synthase [Sphingomicrobium lutaoense]MBB3763301.1 3-dehydroquinate synthase [Sphingomicrobium lutaoense]